MSSIHFSSLRRGLKLSPLAFTLGMGLWAILGSTAGVSAIHDTSGQGVIQCLDAADVMASLDRSRNGVSLRCNLSMISGSAAQ